MANRIKESNITPGAVTSDKIAPGTVSASNISPGSITTTQIATDTIASSNIAPGTIANDRLANTGITINGTTIALGASGDISAGTDWQSVITAAGGSNTAVAGEGYFIDTTSAAHTVTLPSSPSQGDEVTIVDYAGTFGLNNVTVGRNGSNIDGVATDGTLAINRLNVRFVYIDATQGWKAIFDDASGSYGNAYISATGGTVTTSGDFKIHTFTGDGCFAVSQSGSGTGPSVVDYLVVAGGGSGGRGCSHGGGGGAGGYRESHSTPVSGCYTASPLATPTGITVNAITYPITVGAGGGFKATPGDGNSGSPSIFSTITSAGGGGGAKYPTRNGVPGGSGGGGASVGCGGTGNTPPVSPPQGNPGGDSTCNSQMAGGGGATAAGGNRPGPAQGGNGATTSISGSPTAYAGGGGGGGGAAGPVIPGGTGGGGDGSGTNCSGTAGTANTGGGGGGHGGPPGGGGAGGKGIVIIRYKYQN